jgi:hypothetical protein
MGVVAGIAFFWSNKANPAIGTKLLVSNTIGPKASIGIMRGTITVKVKAGSL